ncbi:HSP20 family protein [Bacillus sp. OV194]|nr:HSP20 family protein [Bacillus sp. OV194]
MSLIPYEPFRQLSNMRRDFERIFAESPFDLGAEGGHFGNIRVDIHETDSEVVATCDIPGLEKKEDININIEKNILSISGSMNKTHEVKQENMHRKERYSGSFHRAITLPASVSKEGVKATYKNGVLEITMPKIAQNNTKKIDVEFH